MKARDKAYLRLRLDPDVKKFIDETKTEYQQTSMQGFVMFMVKEFRKHHNKQVEDE